MTCKFGDFELDEECRELRLRGEAIPLQPRVFDLLVILWRNRQRVMSKEELLDALWPGVVVGDGSLQRAVSLARSALKPGGLGSAIRNYARQGYRLCLDEGEPASTREALDSAREAFERGDWDAAIRAYAEADAQLYGWPRLRSRRRAPAFTLRTAGSDWLRCLPRSPMWRARSSS